MPEAIGPLAISTASLVDEVDLEVIVEINTICQRFEEKHRAGVFPRIEDYCIENDVLGPRLLSELIILEHNCPAISQTSSSG